MLTRLLFLACLVITSIVPALAETPIQVVHQLTDAIRKGDKAAIAPFYVTFKGGVLDLTWIDSLLASSENDFVSPTWCFDSKTNIGAAVVIVGSLKGRILDLDPCYMVPI